MSSQSDCGSRNCRTLSPGAKWARTFTGLSPAARDPRGDGVGLLGAGTRGGEVVIGVDPATRLVGAAERVIDALGVRGIDAGVLVGVDHQCRTVDAGQVRLGPGLRVAQ